MPAYSEDRRATKVPRLPAVTRNEGLEASSDVDRLAAYERALEANADEQRRLAGKGRKFSDLVKDKPKK